jgi:hypothetical protein
MTNDRHKRAYSFVLVESFEPEKTSGKHGAIHIRPVAGQVFQPSLFVSCSRKMTDEANGSCQERCHLLEAFYSSLAKATWRLVCWVANGSLIHTKSGCFQQRIDLLQRFGFAMRASS